MALKRSESLKNSAQMPPNGAQTRPSWVGHGVDQTVLQTARGPEIHHPGLFLSSWGRWGSEGKVFGCCREAIDEASSSSISAVQGREWQCSPVAPFLRGLH